MMTTKLAAGFRSRGTAGMMQGVHQGQSRLNRICRKLSGFSFAGPKSLSEILKVELFEDKTNSEMTDIWAKYHESKENVHGLVLSGKEGKSLAARGAQCPFFIQPIFRDDGFFMLVSQFQEPSHFLMAYLEDYKLDPAAASPLVTFSVFNDYADKRDMSFVRCDIINRAIHDDEGLKVLHRMLDAYKSEEEFPLVHAFNKTPESFDIDDYISRQNPKWNQSAVESTLSNEENK